VVTMVLIGVLLKLRPDVLSKSPSLKDVSALQESND